MFEDNAPRVINIELIAAAIPSTFDRSNFLVSKSVGLSIFLDNLVPISVLNADNKSLVVFADGTFESDDSLANSY